MNILLMIQTTSTNYQGYQTVYKTYIYSLPGQGSASVNESSQVTSRNKKYLRINQVFIDHEEHTYDAKGAKIK